LLKLSQIPEVTEVPSFSEEAQSYLQGLVDGFSMNDALEVKNIEKVTNHDVKAVEYFLKNKCQSHPEIAKVGTHFDGSFRYWDYLLLSIWNHPFL
jgi:adenylosuccinate lyase